MTNERKSAIAALTDDILKEVEDAELEKTASATPEFEATTPLAQGLMKLASDLRSIAAGTSEVTYDDLELFMEKHAGKSPINNLFKNHGSKPQKFKSFDTMDKLEKMKKGATKGDKTDKRVVRAQPEHKPWY